MSTKRSKRWTGELDSLSTDFLKEVIQKMDAYGDRVQFESPGKRRGPHYQVINARDMKMGFDERHLLLRLNPDGNVSNELGTIFTLEAVNAALDGGTRKPGRQTGGAAVAKRSTSRGAPPVPAPVDTVEQDKYAYFKANRDFLPEGITRHSQEISQLMRDGMTAEQAFETVINRHF